MENKNLWSRFGCFLTGYEINLLNECSANSRAAVAKYTSALIIISCIWAFIGYSFCTRYIGLGIVGGVIGAIIMMVLIIQIERQIILAFKPNWRLAFFRIFIAILMAAIGSVITDQIVFKQDIENLKATYASINQSLKNQFDDFKTEATNKKKLILDNNLALKKQDSAVDLKIKRTSPVIVTGKTKTTDTSKKTVEQQVYGANPQFDQLQNQKKSIHDDIQKNHDEINAIDGSLEAKNLDLIKKMKPDKKGFLNEIDLLFNFIFEESSSKMPMIVWLFFLLFFLGVELFVLLTKSSKDKNDYELLVLYQQAKHAEDLEERRRLEQERIAIRKKNSDGYKDN
jgi:NADH:ubiquinone oxidoreductase subunit 6 (subunit J)